MDLVLDEEQTLLQRAVKDFALARSPVVRARRPGFSHALWKEMADLGWLGLTISEEHGGTGLGARYLMVVLEELGKVLAPEPLISTTLLGVTAIDGGGTDAQKKEHLPAVARGERIIALAHHERRGRFGLAAIDVAAVPRDGGWVLRGEKLHVDDGPSADLFIVSARTADDIALFLVPAKSPNLTIVPESRLDGRGSATVRLDGVTLAQDARLSGRGRKLLERVVDAGAIGLSAEMLGGMTASLAMTLDYLRTREQFGVAIGTFQALQHRAGRMFVDVELSRSAVMSAHATLDDLGGGAAVSRAASIAKAKCSDAFMRITHEAVQLHGGIGMTEEHDIGLYLKRARVAEMTLGDAAWHRDRFARIEGF